MADSATLNGWHWDRINSQLEFFYRGTKVGHLSSTGLNIVTGNTLTIDSGGTLTSSGTITLAGTNSITSDVTMTAGKFISGSPIKATKTVKTSGATLTTAETGVIECADAVKVYVPTYVGNTGLTYTITAPKTFSSGVTVYVTGGTETIGGAVSKISTAVYDSLTIVAGTDGYNIASKVGTWN